MPEGTSRRRQSPPSVSFITCTHCGPRFSIVSSLPYDRERTHMAPFVQCPVCQKEYDNPYDRRYFSQTNSCPSCGIQLRMHPPAEDPYEQALALLRAGDILAVKGIGGFLLLCDATAAASIQTLRKRKFRPSKPFALLYPNLKTLEKDAELGDSDREALEGPVAPIVLLHYLAKPASGISTEDIAPGLPHIGVMLPYAPLLALIARDFGKPLVATSGNPSGSPIVYQDEQALAQLFPGIADAVLLHNREIALPQDDSVLRHSTFTRQPILLRRSRGLAPYADPGPNPGGESVLAMGASLKSAFAWQNQGKVYLSQYLGDLERFDTQQHFEHTLQHFTRLLASRPQTILIDTHPEYFSTHLGLQMASDRALPIFKIQHHKAHFAAVLAENELLESAEPVLGIIWDGTGFGEDEQVWGGEFFRWENRQMDRVGQMAYFDFILGDKMPREPRISALSLAHDQPEAQALLQAKFDATEWSLYTRMLEKETILQCSSMGRIFDAVASLLGLADRVSYEGEAAMRLEAVATRWFRSQGGLEQSTVLPFNWENGMVPTKPLIKAVLQFLDAGASVEQTAAVFHLWLVDIIAEMGRRSASRRLAFSGGVWQNALLTDLVRLRLGKEFELYFHQNMSPNDECVAYGQLMLHRMGH
ncbi:MAG: carbamoyltransferase HypF [Lewinellaceae bacterium]|nr:carbamoyltransferase HypF [Lewinellaceae bacterium]